MGEMGEEGAEVGKEEDVGGARMGVTRSEVEFGPIASLIARPRRSDEPIILRSLPMLAL